ncbi:MAG: 23S rRNA (cytidine(2498)-2'-O)-methyltransferase RlmM [Arhodomonas sp.]|nr:23S rRNA (cytidine(2498)-2'-O)-methyltransferase RlmM [Arhodomonas sp.]
MILYARPGAEGDLAAELTERTTALGDPGYCEAAEGSGVVLLHAADPAAADRLWERLRWRELIFARQLAREILPPQRLPAGDRATPLAAAVAAMVTRLDAVWLEYPDTNEGKRLSRFCRRFERPVERALHDAGVATGVAGAPRLHCLFGDSSSVRVVLSRPGTARPGPSAYPGFGCLARRHRARPSKLDEAFQALLTEDQRRRWLRPGGHAVDLGAAPGGWSWQLVRRGLTVTAVDNGPMDPGLLADGCVEHLRVDGFRYRPPRPVDWVVCDMVERPQRIVTLMAQWLRRGDARAALFNLKLPMRQRYRNVSEALSRLRRGLGEGWQIAVKQLYHDRDEVSVCVIPASPGNPGADR